MTAGDWVSLALLGCLASPAHADDPHPVSLPGTDRGPLPILAANPDPAASVWRGLYIGSGISVVGGRGTKGFVGGDVYGGYNRAFDNNVVLGLKGGAGTVPGLYGLGPITAYNAAAADMKLGYALGRLTPYVTSGLILAKPAGGIGSGLGADYPNALFATPGRTETSARVGAGFDYALTGTTTIGLGLSYSRGPAAILP